MRLTSLHINTEVGFSEAFKFLRQRSIREEVPSESYKSVLNEFNALKNQYSSFSSNVKPNILKSLEIFTSTEEVKFKKLYENNLTTQSKDVISSIGILSVALYTEKERLMYAKAHNSVTPLLMNFFVSKESEKESKYILSRYECKYLEMILPLDKLNEIKNGLKYTCKK